jgi:hypothetical protein
MGLNKSGLNAALVNYSDESKGDATLLMRMATKQAFGDNRQVDSVDEITQEKE